jgi:gamma-resorcylate decarboxylase
MGVGGQELWMAKSLWKNIGRRFAGFAALPVQDPDAAARELTRCINKLGFKGAMCHCFTQRHVSDSAIYYDLPEFRPFWSNSG